MNYTDINNLTEELTNVAITDNFSLYVIGGHSSSVNQRIEVYKNEEWHELPNMSGLSGRSYFACAKVDNTLYIIGGRDSRTGNSMSSIECYNITKEEWSTFHLKMKIPRSEFGVVGVNDILYCIGGYGEASNTMEQLNVTTNELLTTYEITGPRKWGHAVALCRNKIYITGGQSYVIEGDERQDSTYMYYNQVNAFNIATKTWENIQSMLRRRCYHSVATTHDKFIYAVGGFGDECIHKTRVRLVDVERFDVQTGQWTMITPLPIPMSNLVACEKQNTLIILGGITGHNRETKCTSNYIYEYDSNNNTWIMSGNGNSIVQKNMIYKRHSFCAIIVLN